jgi:hypothetical protein
MIQIREPISVAVSSSFRGRATAQQVRQPCPPYANCSYGMKVWLSAGSVQVAENPGTFFRELRLYSSCKGLLAKVEVVAQGNQ